jgi:putative ABC transport system permease protein
MRTWHYWRQALVVALKNLYQRRLRSGLALLGVILGVGSVIAMLAIGEGSKARALAQIAELGAANVIVTSVKPGAKDAADEAGESTVSQQKVSRVVEYGLKYADLDALRKSLPTLADAVPASLARKDAWHGGSRIQNARIKGVTPEYQRVKRLEARRGRFVADADGSLAANVAVLGSQAALELFGFTDPLESDISIGGMAFRVVGVLAPAGTSADERDIYVPLETARRRFGELQVVRTAGSVDYERVQLAEIVLQTRATDLALPTAEMVRAILARRHPRGDDFEVQAPLELQRRAEKQQSIWNLVLGSIAGISLLVGGIGIMNIMLANVTEQTREIGIRRAIGAKRRDIVAQFLTEAVVLSSTGGLLGVALGVGAPWCVEHFAGIDVIVRPWAVLLAFSISSGMGIIFGIYPAARAARMDPIQALRHA